MKMINLNLKNENMIKTCVFFITVKKSFHYEMMLTLLSAFKLLTGVISIYWILKRGGGSTGNAHSFGSTVLEFSSYSTLLTLLISIILPQFYFLAP